MDFSHFYIVTDVQRQYVRNNGVRGFGYRDRYLFGSQVQIFLLCITISPNALKKLKEKKKKDLDAYRTRLIVNCLVLLASQSHLSARVCV